MPLNLLPVQANKGAMAAFKNIYHCQTNLCVTFPSNSSTLFLSFSRKIVELYHEISQGKNEVLIKKDGVYANHCTPKIF